MKALLLLLLVFALPAWANKHQEWQEDIDTFASELQRRHIQPYTRISKTAFDEQIQNLKKTASSKSDLQIIIELMKLTRQIGDGHTAVHFQQEKCLQEFPLDIYNDAGKWRVIGIDKKFKHLSGAELLSIDNKNMTEIYDRLSTVVQFVENKNSEQQRVSQYLKLSELLFELGISSNPTQAQFVFAKDDEQLVVKLEASLENADLLYFETTRPKITKIADAGIAGLWYGDVTDTQGVYVRFAKYPSFDQMDAFAQKLLQHINKQQKQQLIIDMRGNRGGDFYVGVWLAYYLNLADSLDWLNGIYTLVDKDTFSAATINATQYKQLLNAKIVGEPTGSNPNGFQDMGTFKLPNSGLMISYSKRLFKLEQDGSQGLQPDIAINYAWDAYKNGEDNMLLWIIRKIQSTREGLDSRH